MSQASRAIVWNTLKYLVIVSMSVLFALLIAEVYSRYGYPYGVISYIRNGNFYVAERSIWSEDQVRGFSYKPNYDINFSFVSHDRVVRCAHWITNSMGNIGAEPPPVADRTIAVFGDSFTSYPQGDPPMTWPEKLQARLSSEGQSVRLLNFARDGYGVLQMIDQIAAEIQKSRFDRILIAFITDDLARQRFWRFNVSTNGSEEMIARFDLARGLATDRRTVLLFPQATSSWCKRMVASPSTQATDETFIGLQHYKSLQDQAVNDFLKNFDRWTFRRSFLYDRLHNASALGRFDFDDYASDKRSFDEIELIKQSGIPVSLVWLPAYDELNNGSRALSLQQRRLLDSLLRISGFPLIDMLPAAGKGNAAPYYLLPADYHPSEDGLALFSESLEPLLAEHPGEG